MDLTEKKPQPKDFIPEDKDANLVEVHRVNKDQFGVIYKRNVSHFVFIPLPLADIPLGQG
jgi:hypothetical protein